MEGGIIMQPDGIEAARSKGNAREGAGLAKGGRKAEGGKRGGFTGKPKIAKRQQQAMRPSVARAGGDDLQRFLFSQKGLTRNRQERADKGERGDALLVVQAKRGD